MSLGFPRHCLFEVSCRHLFSLAFLRKGNSHIFSQLWIVDIPIYKIWPRQSYGPMPGPPEPSHSLSQVAVVAVGGCGAAQPRSRRSGTSHEAGGEPGKYKGGLIFSDPETIKHPEFTGSK